GDSDSDVSDSGSDPDSGTDGDPGEGPEPVG
ncbi:MAG: hypothetical protein QOJ48_1364, partial [Frankiales bacterium]|nr:hypothetical protein [Frankiales bacterium]